MTDFIDISSNNGPVDFAAYKAAGHDRIAIKATEGTTYTWDGFQGAVRAAHTVGLKVYAYDFDRGLGDAGYFLAACASAAVMPLLTGIVLDFEDTATADDANAFMQAIEDAHTGLELWIYAGAYKISETGLRYRMGWSWWVAAYTPTMPPAPAGWPAPVAWQFSQNATGPWISGPVDLSHLLHDTSTCPPPNTTVLEDDMAALVTFPNDPKGREFCLTADRAWHAPNPAVVADMQNAGILAKSITVVGQQTLEAVTPGVTK